MKSLLGGCAAIALVMGFAGNVHAQASEAPAPDDLLHAVRTEAAPPAPTVPAVQLSTDEAALFTGLGSRITDAASVYETYVRNASSIDPHFANGAAVRGALRSASAYGPRQLEEGVVAYAALLALRNPDFVDGVRAMQNTDLADRLTASPQAVLEVGGADRAAADVTGVLDAQAAALIASGKAITQSAYDIQHQSWSTVFVPDQTEVLAEAKAAASQARTADTPSEKRLLASLTAAPRGLAPHAVSTSPAVTRGLALAAMAILGRTGDRADADIELVLYDAAGVDCIKLARIDLNQCLAAAGPYYEDAFCLGRHAIGEASQCVVAAVDADGPALVDARSRLTTAALDPYGPERAAAFAPPPLAYPDAQPAPPAYPDAQASPPVVAQAPDADGAPLNQAKIYADPRQADADDDNDRGYRQAQN